ncbi:hypothetical protein HYS72_01300 [Candidatus Pacearchaeota archaeon]|nr:hypothetical protein [Candidatus Pacearchaeota archaeon]MBI2056982.1 hypothetical protein [Candidatus Pacearchaeota archaeon]
MPQNQPDHLQVKEKIISFIKMRGPSLPVHIGKEINTNILFTSAFLSELISEKRLKISNLNVGNSHLYFIPEQESLLEGFSQHLKSKEKEAFELLKQKKVLKDFEQHPAIRVALRGIRDFAIPFKKDDQLYWKYLMVSDQELINKIKEMPAIKTEQKPKKIEIVQPSLIKTKKKEPKKIKEKTPGKKGDKFFNKVKEFLSKSLIEILDVEDASKDYLTLRIKIKNEEKLLVAYNKKKIDESDIIKAYKKSSELKLNFMILSFGEPNKKLNEFIEAVKKLDGIEKIE